VQEGATSLLQYIGDANDTVTFSAVAILPLATHMQDIQLSLFRNVQALLEVDTQLDALILQVQAAQPTIQVANKNGVANLILWSQGVPVGFEIRCSADVIPEGA